MLVPLLITSSFKNYQSKLPLEFYFLTLCIYTVSAQHGVKEKFLFRSDEEEQQALKSLNIKKIIEETTNDEKEQKFDDRFVRKKEELSAAKAKKLMTEDEVQSMNSTPKVSFEGPFKTIEDLLQLRILHLSEGQG